MTIHRLIQRAAFRTTIGLAVAAPVVSFAQAAPSGASSATPQDEIAQTVETGKAQVPCVVNADAVVVRSGPGENYYPTMKLDKGAKVTVVGHKFGWLKVYLSCSQTEGIWRRCSSTWRRMHATRCRTEASLR